MFFNKKSASLEIAQRIIRNTGLDENLGILKQKKHIESAEPRELLKFVMALSACNLVQTMKADFVVQGFPAEHLKEITRDYVLESLDKQDLVKLKGKSEIEGMRLAVMEIVGELQGFWKEEEDPQGSGPGPRYYCVKEVLKRLGGQPNYDLHDALFELMYLQHRHYIRCFKELLAETA
ncbi:MAG TPA: hypothetical protein VIJ93_04450 [bacterium]